MVKKIILIGMASIFILVMFGNTAIAKCSFSAGRLVCSDLCAETILDKVPNPKTSDTHVCSALYIDTVSGQAYNPALNSSIPENLNFQPNLSFQVSDNIQASEVDDKGYAVKTLCFTDYCKNEFIFEEEIGCGFYPYDPDCDEFFCEPCNAACSGLEALYNSLNVSAGIDLDTCELLDPDGDGTPSLLCQGSEYTPNTSWWLDTESYSIEVAYVYFSFYSYAPNGGLKSSGGECQICTPYVPDPDNLDEDPPSCGLTCEPTFLAECEGRGLTQSCQDAVDCIQDPTLPNCSDN